jgi:D-apionolactonase
MQTPDGGLSRRDLVLIALAAPPVTLTQAAAAENRLALSAGPVTLEFQPDIAFIRYVRLGSAEILRGVYAAVRDQYWGTVPPRVTNIETTRGKDGFHLTFDVDCKEKDVDFFWKGTIHGKGDGTLRFTMDGVARSTFQRNRIGFCVLHPLKECVGQPCTIRTGSGEQRTRFPEDISPHQPFKDLRSITHEVSPGVRAEVSFEGDVFETEDHRNWTDANFKTYCTPLERPYPVRVEEGTKIQQAVTIRLLRSGDAASQRPANSPSVITLRQAGPPRKLPQIGYGFDPGLRPLAGSEAKQLKSLRPAHLRIDLELAGSDWLQRLRTAAERARDLSSKLECAVFVNDSASSQLEALAPELTKVPVSRVLMFHSKELSTQSKWIDLARRQLPSGLSIGAGTNIYFTELNRQRPPVEILDAVCYSINPQVHAFDDASIVENLEGQAHTVRSARKFVGKKWLAVSPVTLRPRFNPNGGSDPAQRIDPRQKSAVGAAWTLGSCKYLAETGADSVTYYELVGSAGLLDGADVFPLFQVFRSLADFADGEVIPIVSSDPLAVEAMLVRKSGKQRMLVANMTPQPQTFRYAATGFSRKLRPFELLTA